jgi:hypothetical protein
MGFSQVTVENDPAKQFKKDLSKRVLFENINFSMQPPLHFIQPDTGFTGFMHIGVGASIAIAPVPYRSYKNVNEEFKAKDFKAAGSELITSTSIVLDSKREAFLHTVRFTIQDKIVERIVLIVGTDEKTFMVYANYPALVSPLLSQVLDASFKTIEFE